LHLEGEERETFLATLELPVEGVPEATTLMDELSRVFSSAKVSPELKTILAVEVQRVLETWKAMQRKKVRWAVIPVAGWQARVLAPKATAQVVLRAIAEAHRAGIERSLIVVAPSQKEPLAQHLTALASSPGHRWERQGRLVVQGEQSGLGHALLAARGYLPEHEPFALILPDEGVEDACLDAMLHLYDTHKCCVIAVRELQPWDEQSAGLVSIHARQGNICIIKALVEKPECRLPEASLAILGRYVLTPEIFKVLEMTSTNPRSGHTELTDALDLLARRQTLYGYIYAGRVCSIAPSRRQLMDRLEAFLRA